MGTKLTELKTALLAWRASDLEVSKLVLCAEHPKILNQQIQRTALLLDVVREIIDSEPWADIEQGL